MFCTQCGHPMADSANFCTTCGHAVSLAAAGAAGSVSATQSAAPAPARYPAPAAGVPCAWCGSPTTAGDESCPACGAALDRPAPVTHSGWTQLPGRKDMAKLQFGNSFCQIEGQYVPVADMNLAAGDSVYFTHHVLLWKDTSVNIGTLSLRGGWKRLFAGLPLIMTQATGPGHIAFSHDAPGELISVPLHPGQIVDVREHLFLAATSNVPYDWFSTNIWFTTGSGNDKETHYPVGMLMDRFSAGQTPGLLLLHAAGNVFLRKLAPGQTILVKPTAFIFKDPSVEMQLHFEHPRGRFGQWGTWSNRYLWLRLTGPGRVAVQSVFEKLEGEARNITNYSYATEWRW